jgi:hypothetical protein
LQLIPIVSNNGGFFTISNYINNITINNNTGLISVNSGLDIGIYNLIISYSINNIISLFNYSIKVLSKLYYDISSSTINYNTSGYSTYPIVDKLIGLFTIPINYIDNGITIDSSFGKKSTSQSVKGSGSFAS